MRSFDLSEKYFFFVIQEIFNRKRKILDNEKYNRKLRTYQNFMSTNFKTPITFKIQGVNLLRNFKSSMPKEKVSLHKVLNINGLSINKHRHQY